MNDIYKPKLLRVPVKFINGNWEYFYGGFLPMKEGAVADLILNEGSVKDKQFIEKLKCKSRHKILDKGTKLLVALTIKSEPAIDAKLYKHLMSLDSNRICLGTVFHQILLSVDTRFVSITIGGATETQKNTDPNAEGGIWLDVQGLRPKGVITSGVDLPEGVSDEPAISLNHAFTLLSEAYEPWRKSHTGNIYDRMFYKEKNGKWYPLEVLRNRAITKDENQLINDQWKKIVEELKLSLT